MDSTSWTEREQAFAEAIVLASRSCTDEDVPDVVLDAQGAVLGRLSSQDLGVLAESCRTLREDARARRNVAPRAVTVALVQSVIVAPVSRRVGYINETILRVSAGSVPDSVQVWVNSGGICLVVEQALARVGFRVQPVQYDGHGMMLVVSR